MNYLLIAFIITIWLFSTFIYAKWRIHSKVQNQGIMTNVLNDGPMNFYLIVTLAIVLVLICYLI